MLSPRTNLKQTVREAYYEGKEIRTFPSREICSFEEGVFQNTFDSSQRSDHVDTVVVELPQFSIVTLRCPPEWIAERAFRFLWKGTGNEKLTASRVGTVSSPFVHAIHDHTPNYKALVQYEWKWKGISRMSVLLEEGVNTGYTSIPAIFQVL